MLFLNSLRTTGACSARISVFWAYISLHGFYKIGKMSPNVGEAWFENAEMLSLRLLAPLNLIEDLPVVPN